jgi:hypothetical protein
VVVTKQATITGQDMAEATAAITKETTIPTAIKTITERIKAITVRTTGMTTETTTGTITMKRVGGEIITMIRIKAVGVMETDSKGVTITGASKEAIMIQVEEVTTVTVGFRLLGRNLLRRSRRKWIVLRMLTIL